MVGSKPFFSALLDKDTSFQEKKTSAWVQFLSYLSFWNTAEKRKRAFHANFKGVPPQGIPHPFLKTRKITFNHVFSFYLDEQNQPWYAGREHPEQAPVWKPLYVDGLPSGQQHDMEIIADGANLMIAVTTGKSTTVHYKKIIEEKRIRLPNGKLRYLIKNLCEEASSITEWFSLPFIKYLKYKEWGKQLTLQPGATWAMSHVGAFKCHSLHPSGIAHSIWGTTTLYEIVDDVIRLHDPFVSIDSVLEIALPHSDRCIFKLISVDASGSLILLLGEEMEQQSDGSYLSSLVIYTKLLDYDVMGCNPLQQCSHNPNSLKRFIRIPKWEKHDLPSGQINSTVTVVQTGIDYHNVELRISGNHNQKSGFFYKSLREDKWSFKKYSEAIHLLKSDSEPTLRSSSGMLFHREDTFTLNGHPFQAAYCESFHEKATYVPLSAIDSSGNSIKMHLHRRRNLIKAFFGLKSDYWHLVLDESSSKFRYLFKDESSIPVKVFIQNGAPDQLILSSPSHSLYLEASKAPAFQNCNAPDSPEILSVSKSYLSKHQALTPSENNSPPLHIPQTKPTPQKAHQP